jgi:hypothetical protein
MCVAFSVNDVELVLILNDLQPENNYDLIGSKHVSNYFCLDAICTSHSKDLRRVCRVLLVNPVSIP